MLGQKSSCLDFCFFPSFLPHPQLSAQGSSGLNWHPLPAASLVLDGGLSHHYAQLLSFFPFILPELGMQPEPG